MFVSIKTVVLPTSLKLFLFWNLILLLKNVRRVLKPAMLHLQLDHFKKAWQILSTRSSKFNRRLTLTVTSLSSAVVLTPNFISNRTLVKRSRRKKLINALHNCKGILKQANWCLKILTTLVEYHYQCAYQRLMHAHQTKFISVHWLVEAT